MSDQANHQKVGSNKLISADRCIEGLFPAVAAFPDGFMG
ncbi:hypothetical protein SAMN05414137_110113 [Streptacidiphilus jiangxiensis]|uniref:Uncharacterized protein n=1 Tax=Streptacidiphilus jiangxiensis TaxID=235985 RepID=A0A1H7RFU9_STRJI|nr:hypothetical protein SAMN05414137_110113 [Streptacidiphilus jiangxiensis]